MEQQFTLAAFARFCRSKGKTPYNWTSMASCACAQYEQFLGFKPQSFGDRKEGGFWAQAEAIAERKPWRFDALADRLESGESS